MGAEERELSHKAAGPRHVYSSSSAAYCQGTAQHAKPGPPPGHAHVPLHVGSSPETLHCLRGQAAKSTAPQTSTHRVSRMLRRVPNVPGLLTLTLCGLAFWFGRVSISTSLLPDPGVAAVNPGNPTRRTGRSLQSQATEVRLIGADSTTTTTATSKAASSEVALPSIDPYDLDSFEAAVSRGLSALKPPMTPGESGEAFYRTIPFQILSWYPRIMVFPNFVDKARREEVIAAASRQLARSRVMLCPGEAEQPDQQVRTSWGAFLSGDATPALQWLEEKVAAVTFLPAGNGEPWNVLNYVETQHYDSHMDTCDPIEYGPQYSQRIATVIVVLSDEGLVGGETVFKREGRSNGNKPISNWTDCDAQGGLKYKPRAGDAILFWNLRPDGSIDPHSLHGSCPVAAGAKWGAVKWIHNKVQRNA